MIDANQIANRLTLRKYPHSWRGDCPNCSYHAAFAVKVSKAGYPRLFCSNGCTAEELTAEVGRILGGGLVIKKADPLSTEEDRARKREASARLWNGSSLTGLHHRYLAARGLPGLATSSALRFRGDCPHPEGKRHPAMVALVQDATGAQIGAHRTYLRQDGSGKADIEPAKASLGPIWGGAIRLDPVAAEIVIGEGIETSASAGILLGLPAWAAISAGNLGQALILPDEVRSVVIAADNDGPGEREAMNAARRWHAEGRKVRIARIGRAGVDFNDILMEGAHHA